MKVKNGRLRRQLQRTLQQQAKGGGGEGRPTSEFSGSEKEKIKCCTTRWLQSALLGRAFRSLRFPLERRETVRRRQRSRGSQAACSRAHTIGAFQIDLRSSPYASSPIRAGLQWNPTPEEKMIIQDQCAHSENRGWVCVRLSAVSSGRLECSRCGRHGSKGIFPHTIITVEIAR